MLELKDNLKEIELEKIYKELKNYKLLNNFDVALFYRSYKLKKKTIDQVLAELKRIAEENSVDISVENLNKIKLIQDISQKDFIAYLNGTQSTEKKNQELEYLLIKLFKKYPDKNYFQARIEYVLDGNFSVVLPLDIIKRASEKKEGEYRYEILSEKKPEKAASGAFGGFKDSLGRLALRDIDGKATLERCHLTKESSKKFIKHGAKILKLAISDEAEIKKEYEYNKLSKKSHAKSPVFFENADGEKFAVIFMRKLGDKRLNEYASNNTSLSIEHIYDFFIEILRAYKKQILDTELIHGDIKSDNILVQISNVAEYDKEGNKRFVKVYFIDFGMSCKNSEEKKVCFPEKLLHQAPELRDGALLQVETSADIYSIGYMFNKLLEPMTKDMWGTAYHKSYSPLKNIISTMIKLDPEERPTIENILKELEKNHPLYQEDKKDAGVILEEVLASCDKYLANKEKTIEENDPIKTLKEKLEKLKSAGFYNVEKIKIILENTLANGGIENEALIKIYCEFSVARANLIKEKSTPPKLQFFPPKQESKTNAHKPAHQKDNIATQIKQEPKPGFFRRLFN